MELAKQGRPADHKFQESCLPRFQTHTTMSHVLIVAFNMPARDLAQVLVLGQWALHPPSHLPPPDLFSTAVLASRMDSHIVGLCQTCGWPVMSPDCHLSPLTRASLHWLKAHVAPCVCKSSFPVLCPFVSECLCRVPYFHFTHVPNTRRRFRLTVGTAPAIQCGWVQMSHPPAFCLKSVVSQAQRLQRL